jgi:hypothetical protein
MDAFAPECGNISRFEYSYVYVFRAIFTFSVGTSLLHFAFVSCVSSAARRPNADFIHPGLPSSKALLMLLVLAIRRSGHN